MLNPGNLSDSAHVDITHTVCVCDAKCWAYCGVALTFSEAHSFIA
jgi:hypothetical protein